MIRLWIALIRFGFRLLYYEMAWTYDLVSWVVSMGEWRNWQKTALTYVQGRDVLEIGHGPGHMLVALTEQGYQTMGLDLSPYMGRLAQKRTTAPLLRASVTALPFLNATFDTVLSTFPTNYIIDPDTLTAVYRILRPNGRLVILPAARLTGHGLSQRLITLLYRLTGQSTAPAPAEAWEPFRSRITAVGFTVTIKTITLPRSEATVIIAEK